MVAEKERQIFAELLAEVISCRDELHASCTRADGSFDHPDDAAECARLDQLIDRAREQKREWASERDPLCEALNSGDGSYRP